MDNIVSQNIRGLNWSNKQEGVKIFLHNNQVGLIGLLETKINAKNADEIVESIFNGWQWKHNCEILNGKIWLAWHPCSYSMNV